MLVSLSTSFAVLLPLLFAWITAFSFISHYAGITRPFPYIPYAALIAVLFER